MRWMSSCNQSYTNFDGQNRASRKKKQSIIADTILEKQNLHLMALFYVF